jgi:hypothetical protein
MQQTDDIIDVVPKDRKPRVFALLNYSHDFFGTVIEVNSDYFSRMLMSMLRYLPDIREVAS